MNNNTDIEKFDEKKQAVITANEILDVPYADPDRNEAILARQYLRSLEALQSQHQQTIELIEGMRKIFYEEAKLSDGEQWPIILAKAQACDDLLKELNKKEE